MNKPNGLGNCTLETDEEKSGEFEDLSIVSIGLRPKRKMYLKNSEKSHKLWKSTKLSQMCVIGVLERKIGGGANFPHLMKMINVRSKNPKIQ
jgi:hypothetical protein